MLLGVGCEMNEGSGIAVTNLGGGIAVPWLPLLALFDLLVEFGDMESLLLTFVDELDELDAA